MTPEPSGLGPMGDAQLLAAMLSTDRADVASYARVLSGALADALPPGMVEVSFRRGLADRLAGRDGQPVALTVHGDGCDLALLEDRRTGVRTEIWQVVGGVVISRKVMGLDRWLRALAETLVQAAARTAATRKAFEEFLHTRM
jgi:hypothetical protein